MTTEQRDKFDETMLGLMQQLPMALTKHINPAFVSHYRNAYFGEKESDLILSAPHGSGKSLSLALFSAVLMYTTRDAELAFFTHTDEKVASFMRRVMMFLALLGVEDKMEHETRCANGPRGPYEMLHYTENNSLAYAIVPTVQTTRGTAAELVIIDDMAEIDAGFWYESVAHRLLKVEKAAYKHILVSTPAADGGDLFSRTLRSAYHSPSTGVLEHVFKNQVVA